MKESPEKISRRRVFAGAGAVGAVAAVAAVVPAVKPDAVADAQPAPEKKDGYQVTQHVLRYYQTARV
ncbi:formate dehydrogenase [Calidifontimicrobium sp. SYSU G02091]|uniref:formate dehydrogenase n=1 Tax=Calidifontimicrobium sp. SYSU G02091 TaxID=2926421 RepID=UPI001F53532A|nr:formate dehydrogenase [Calidifontimicrobium sp. SYSU G02091]MCI1191180.1 formate dehydrogenase [Calidifontimicrobium sp. SYSU G02091]